MLPCMTGEQGLRAMQLRGTACSCSPRPVSSPLHAARQHPRPHPHPLTQDPKPFSPLPVWLMPFRGDAPGLLTTCSLE